MRRRSSTCTVCAGTSPARLFRIEQLRAMGYSVLAIDYRGFGQSKGDLPSEASVYEDARAAWERFTLMQPDAANA
jgi:alpha-beta hydrolase superfamily lysophospholipase